MAARRHPVTEMPASVLMPDWPATANVSIESAPRRQLKARAKAINRMPSPASAVSFFQACKAVLLVFTTFTTRLSLLWIIWS